eukprot:scaffold113966_cov63-Phaeocystis_antarctica.AAC.3
MSVMEGGLGAYQHSARRDLRGERWRGERGGESGSGQRGCRKLAAWPERFTTASASAASAAAAAVDASWRACVRQKGCGGALAGFDAVAARFGRGRRGCAARQSRSVAAISAATCRSTALCHASTSGSSIVPSLVPRSFHAMSSSCASSLARSSTCRTAIWRPSFPPPARPSASANVSTTARSAALISLTQRGVRAAEVEEARARLLPAAAAGPSTRAAPPPPEEACPYPKYRSGSPALPVATGARNLSPSALSARCALGQSRGTQAHVGSGCFSRDSERLVSESATLPAALDFTLRR